MPYLFLLIANVAGISKVIAMKNSGKVCPGEYNSVRINTLRSILCGLVSLAIFFIAGANAELNGWWIWLVSGLSNALMMFLWVVFFGFAEENTYANRNTALKYLKLALYLELKIHILVITLQKLK